MAGRGIRAERGGLHRLLADIGVGLVDQIVVYKIDRLTRSLSDFAKIVDRLEAAGATFVSVTQSFNTATSMGRLTLNMLLSFAQFEREVTAERIRDKIAASKRKGLWMGGTVPFGYRADGRSLVINEIEAPVIRHICALYLEFDSVREVAKRTAELGYRTRLRTFPTGRSSGGTPFARGHVWHILANPLYAGRIRHRDKVHDGQHPAIIAPVLWQQVQDRLTGDAARDRGKGNASVISPLAGKLFDETGDRLTPSHTQKNGKRLRYYISRRLETDRRRNHADAWWLPAREIERGIAGVLRDHLIKPAVLTELIDEVMASEISTCRPGCSTSRSTAIRTVARNSGPRCSAGPTSARAASCYGLTGSCWQNGSESNRSASVLRAAGLPRRSGCSAAALRQRSSSARLDRLAEAVKIRGDFADLPTVSQAERYVRASLRGDDAMAGEILAKATGEIHGDAANAT